MLEQIQRIDPKLAIGWENLLEDLNDAHQRIDTHEEGTDEWKREFEARMQYLQRQIEELRAR